MSTARTRLCAIAATLLLALFVALALTSMRQKSATWDETHYLGVGAYLLQEGRWDIPSARLHPPLPFYLSSLPLLLEGTDVSGFERGATARYGRGIARGRQLLATSRHGPDGLLFRSRLPTVFIGALLGTFVFLWSRALHGPAGALLSVFLFALSPNLLAHSRLATADVCLTTFGFIACFFAWRGLRSGAVGSLGAAGFFLGLALLSKYPALLWLAILVGLGLVELPTRTLARRLGGSFAVAAAVLVVGYGFQPLELARGLAEQLALVSSGREPSFLNGEVSNQGWWYYYLYALLVKLPIAMLLLLLARALLPRASSEAGRRDAAFLLTPPAVFLATFSLAGSVNNGLRYVLPILPFLFVWVGGLAQARAWRQPRGQAPLATALGVLLAWYAAASVAIHPHPLAYFNELVGGPRHGHRHLLDSNLDWGQDLPGLAAYQAEHELGPIKLCYFGSADPGQHGVAYRPLPGCTSGPGRLPTREIAPGDLVAISATHLYPLFVELGPVARHFRSQEPLAMVGYSILLFRADVPLQLPPAR